MAIVALPSAMAAAAATRAAAGRLPLLLRGSEGGAAAAAAAAPRSCCHRQWQRRQLVLLPLREANIISAGKSGKSIAKKSKSLLLLPPTARWSASSSAAAAGRSSVSPHFAGRVGGGAAAAASFLMVGAVGLVAVAAPSPPAHGVAASEAAPSASPPSPSPPPPRKDEDGEEAAAAKEAGKGGGAEEQSLWSRFFGSSSSQNKSKEGGEGGGGVGGEAGTVDSDTDVDTDTCRGGPGKRVKVELEPELVDSLPVMSLEEMRRCDGRGGGGGGVGGGEGEGQERLLVSYEGIVYDVTQFANDHPGGHDLVVAAAGHDLEHFFANYVVHGASNKASEWLSPLAVGRLSPQDAERARETTTPAVHVERRGECLRAKRRKIVLVAASLPFWLAARSFVGWIGWLVPPLGRLLARALPVSVPGLTPGAEPLRQQDQEGGDGSQQTRHKVAVVGGGIAGCGAAWALSRSGFDVTLYEARADLGGNARTFDWDFSPFRGAGDEGLPQTVRSCVSVTAWPPIFYKNYTCLLEKLNIETVHMPLSWFLNSKVPGYEGTLWEADPNKYDGSLRKVFERDFRLYKGVCDFTSFVTKAFTLKWTPWRWNDLPSMYDTHQGLGLLNPLTVVPLYSLFKMVGGSDAWWDIVFTPQYTASFLVDELRPFPAVFGPLIEQQIPLTPNSTNSWQGPSKRSERDCNITTCVTWKDAGKGIRRVFELLVKGVDVKKNTRIRAIQVLENGQKRVYDEYDNYVDVDRVIFACPANSVGNIYKSHGRLANTIFSTLVYADDHHPSTGHMHAVMHSDGSVIPSEYRDDCLKRASNYVEVTQLSDGSINIENQYNFGVQTPGPGVYDLPLDQKPVMLIGHALGEGKSYDKSLIRGQGNHARAHPLYSGWNVAAQLSLRLVQGQNGIYYCSNWTTPGNCHDMSFLSGLVCAHAIGAKYPFPNNQEAKKDFHRLRELMGI